MPLVFIEEALRVAMKTLIMNELSTVNKRLSDVNKELLDANEELQVANEELVLMHEELQASLEEFETTNEGLCARTSELQELASMLDSERVRLGEIRKTAKIRSNRLQSSRQHRRGPC